VANSNTVGSTEGSIIAAIITVHRPTKPGNPIIMVFAK
jgi:hypothetical protein